MKMPLEESIPYSVLALLVHAVFYGIYLAKMRMQKRRGIQTMQFGHMQALHSKWREPHRRPLPISNTHRLRKMYRYPLPKSGQGAYETVR